jgi:hypothetical protein
VLRKGVNISKIQVTGAAKDLFVLKHLFRLGVEPDYVRLFSHLIPIANSYKTALYEVAIGTVRFG